MASPVGSLVVRIGADVGDLVKGVNKAETSLSKIGRVAANAGKVIASALAAATAAIAAMVVKGIALGDEISKAAQAIGITAAELGGLRHAARLSGIESEQLDKGLQRLGKTVFDATNGLSTAARALDQLGLKAQDLQKLPLSEQFLKVSDAMKGVDNDTRKLGIAMDIFGRSGAKMINVMNEGSDAIRAMMDESKAFGLQLDTTQSKVVQEASDSIDRMKSSFDGLSMQLAATFGPVAKAAADTIARITSMVTQAIPKLSALASIFLGIRRAADNLSDTELSKELSAITLRTIELNQELEKARDRFEKTSGRNRAGAENEINRILADRTDLLERQRALEEEAAQRMKERAELEAKAPPVDEEDIDGFSEREKRAQQLTQRFRTEVETQKELFNEAQTLFAEGLITSDTMQRVQDSLLQPIEVTTKRLKDTNAERLQIMLDSFKTEAELEQEHYALRLEQLQELYSAELISRQEFHALKEEVEREHQARMNAIELAGMTERQKFEQASMRQRVSNIAGELANITAGVSQHNKKMFALNKAAGIASAILNAYEGISRTLKHYPYPINIGMAAAHAAVAFAQVKAIKATQFGGAGGAAPSLAGSTPAPPVTPVQSGAPAITQRIAVEGIDPNSLFSGRAVRQLAERLQEHIRDGGEVVFVN